jgi:hypothetical protein
MSPKMKKPQPLIIVLIALCILFNCKQNKSNQDDSSILNGNKIEFSKREMKFLGIHMPRGLTKTSDNLEEGYIMFVPTNSASVYLMNRNGEVVHEWKGNYPIENGAYLNNDGSINLQAVDLDFPVFSGGGEAGRIQKISWDSKMLWDFEYANEMHHAHHDIAVLPNGNVLTIAWEARTLEEVLQAGRKPDLIPKAGLWTSTIVEIKPLDKTHGEVVWKWHIWDHLIQDFDPKKDNFGNVIAHPELLNFNVGEELPEPITQDSLDILRTLGEVGRNDTVDNDGSDVYHLNAVNYNVELDQIAFSSPELGEVFIIDHSTTSEEAAGHTGGKWGKGGDFLYRWGNPQNYRQGDSTDQQTFYQHDIRWIENGYPGEGSMTLFNNNIIGRKDSLKYSAVYQIKPEMDNFGNYILMKNKRFGPQEPEWKYIAKDSISFHSPYVSGAQRLKNGNTFINEGAKGRFFEVTPEGEIVWEYLNQFRGNIHEPNGDPVAMDGWVYSAFRANFISSNHPALKGKELIPLEPQPEIFKLPINIKIKEEK